MLNSVSYAYASQQGDQEPSSGLPIASASFSAAAVADSFEAPAPKRETKEGKERPAVDVDFSQVNVRKGMRLSVQVEANLVTALPPKLTTVRFFFVDTPKVTIGTLPRIKLTTNPRISIADNVLIPQSSFQIAYDFRDARGYLCFPHFWICDSAENATGRIDPVGTYVLEERNGFAPKVVRNKVQAARLKAFLGTHGKDQPPIRFGLVGIAYRERQLYPGFVEATSLQPQGTFLHDASLIDLALKKYRQSPLKNEGLIATAAQGPSIYMALPQEPSDNSIAVAGEYIRLAQHKYGKLVTSGDASALIALLRNYGVVTSLTAKELIEYFGI